MSDTVLLIILLVLAAAAVALGLVALLRKPAKPDTAELERRLLEEVRLSRTETAAAVNEAVRAAALTQGDTQRRLDERQDARLRELREQLAASQSALQRTVHNQLVGLDERFGKFTMQNEQKLENIRRMMEERVAAMQAGNEKKLDEMRQTVDEKLQRTLDERLKQSFSLVSESLDKVQKGLGEMQNLANGVGDLKKVLSNVKTRGILGEIQLGAILEEILAPEQYATNIATRQGSTERVEYAVKLPGDGEGESVWLPIDAKFPADAYAALLDAYESADAAAVEAAGKVLDARVRAAAQDIRDKYIHVPETTEFGILFLPVEGLYAEVVRRGLVERLQNDYKINIAGPTTLAALLNSLQMGFRTLAIQKRSSEVWKVLGEVKSEFGRFGDVLEKTKRHLDLASRDIDELVTTRTKKMNLKLRSVTTLGTPDAPDALAEADALDEDE
ncbi:MAG: DNA recombination protein RmuC [Oscillospiraceae bacterium]